VRQRVSSGTPLEPRLGYSRAVREGRHVAVSATAAIWPDGEVVEIEADALAQSSSAS